MRSYGLWMAGALVALAGLAVGQAFPTQGGPGGGQPTMPGQPPAMGMMFFPPIPELAKKMSQIMALREIVRARMSAADIGKALPILKNLRDSEKTLQAHAEQLLEAEKKALLAAGPDDLPNMEAGMKLQQEMMRFGRGKEDAYKALDEGIGREKAGTIRRLLGDAPMMGMPPGTGAGPSPARPTTAGGRGPSLEPPSPGIQVGDLPQESQSAPPTSRGGPGGGTNWRQQPGVTGPGMQMGFPQMGPRITISELIELLEQKLAAMKR